MAYTYTKILGRIHHHMRHNRLLLFWGVALTALTIPWITNSGDVGTAETWACSADSVYDGDTMRVTCGGQRMKLRLYCIDTPEMQQRPWGTESRDYLRQLAPQRSMVQVKGYQKDRYGRLIAEVFDSTGTNLNLKMVRDGQAAEYDKYCRDPAFRQAEQAAQAEGIGVWSKAGLHQTPWEWRHAKRAR